MLPSDFFTKKNKYDILYINYKGFIQRIIEVETVLLHTPWVKRNVGKAHPPIILWFSRYIEKYEHTRNYSSIRVRFAIWSDDLWNSLIIFSARLRILKNADFRLTDYDDIYRMGVMRLFDQTFFPCLESTSGDPAAPRGRRSRHRFTERNPAAWL